MGRMFDLMGEAAERILGARDGKDWETGNWKFRAGVSVALNPGVICPWCEEDVETGRIWLLDEEQGKVLRVWEMKDGRRVVEGSCHPHVGSNQKICMGNAKSVGEALWGKVNLGSVYWEPREWFCAMGHECEGMDDERESYYCSGCDNEFDDEDDVSYGSDLGGSFCQDCWEELTRWCYSCNESVYVGLNGSLSEVRVGSRLQGWCADCIDKLANRCYECEELVDMGDMIAHEDHDYCQECYEELHEDCEECGSRELKEDLKKVGEGPGLCEECWEGREVGEDEED